MLGLGFRVQDVVWGSGFRVWDGKYLKYQGAYIAGWQYIGVWTTLFGASLTCGLTCYSMLTKRRS